MGKIKFSFFLVAALAVLSLSVMAYGQEAEVVEPEKEIGVLSAQFVSIEGDVAVKKAGEEMWRPASLDMLLEAGDRIMSWSTGSAVIETENGNEIEIYPRTEFLIEEMGYDETEKKSKFKVFLGKALFTVQKTFSLKHKFQVETPAAVAAVRGTKFYIYTMEDGTVSVKVLEGVVRVSNALGSVDVGAGEQVTIEPESPPGTPEEWVEGEEVVEVEEVVVVEVEEEEEAVVEVEEETPTVKKPSLGRVEVGMETAGGKGFLKIRYVPEFHFGALGLALNLSLYYGPDDDTMGIFLDRDTGQLGWEISKFEQVLQLIKWVELDTKPLKVRYGRLDNVTLGAGMLMSDYYPNNETGVMAHLHLGVGGGSVFYPTNNVTNVWGSRLFLQLGERLQIGASLVQELQAVTLADDQVQGPLIGTAADAIYSLGSPDIYFQVGTYTGSNVDENFAWSTGIRGDMGFLKYRAEYREGNIIFGYFDDIYERARIAETLSSVVINTFSGYLIQGAISPISNFSLGATYEDYAGQENKLTGEVSLVFSEQIQGSIVYTKRGIGGGGEFDFYKNAGIHLGISYPVSPGTILIITRNEYYDDLGNKTVDVDVSVQIII